MQLLLPGLPISIKDWRKSYRKKIAYYEKEDMTKTLAYEEEKHIYKLQDL